MKLLIIGVGAIVAGLVMAASQSPDFVPTGSLLVLNSNPSGAITAAPIWNRGEAQAPTTIAVSLPGAFAGAGASSTADDRT